MKIYRLFLPFLMVFLPFGCSAQDDILVEGDEEQMVTAESKLSFPNAFSPNGDGRNAKTSPSSTPISSTAGDRNYSNGRILAKVGMAPITARP